MDGRFIAYLRVSTKRQGESGLGLEAQRQAVAQYLNGGAWKLLGEFVEVESGKKSARVQLAAALDRCKLTGATLLVAKMDRLSRNLHFLTGLRDSGVKFLAVDNPEANSLSINIMASVAQYEGEAISARTKAALAVASARRKAAGEDSLGGKRPGQRINPQIGRDAIQRYAAEFAARVRPTAQALRAEGLSLRQIAAKLTEDGVQTPRKKAWSAVTVSALLTPT